MWTWSFFQSSVRSSKSRAKENICRTAETKSRWRFMRVVSQNRQCSELRKIQIMLVLAPDWTKLRGSHAIYGIDITCSKTSFPWAGKTGNMYRFCGKVLFVGDKTRNIIIRPVLRQCRGASCSFLLPVSPFLNRSVRHILALLYSICSFVSLSFL